MKRQNSLYRVVARILGSTVALMAVLVFLGCTKDRFREGYDNGYATGLAEGTHEGFENASHETFEIAEPEAYDHRLDGLIAEDNFRYHKGFLALSVGGGLFAGFCFQYAAFLLLRRQLILIDIDQIILGKSIAADLHRRSPEEILKSISDRLNETTGSTAKWLLS